MPSEGRRSRLEIIYDILVALRREQGMLKPTHVMYKANLSHKLLKEYLDELFEKTMIAEAAKEGQRYIQLTERGLEFIKKFDDLKRFKESFGI